MAKLAGQAIDDRDIDCTPIREIMKNAVGGFSFGMG